MLPEQVDEMLKGYRAAKGRSAHIDVEIDRLRDKLNRTVEEDRRELADITGQRYSSMPHGSECGNPTEEKGIRLLGMKTSPEAQRIIQEIEELEKLRQRQRITVLFVEAWMKGLTDKEQWLIEKQTIDGVSWKEVSWHYTSAFGHNATTDSLKRMRRAAMEKIYAMAR